MSDEMELARLVYDADLLPPGSASMDVVRRRLFDEISSGRVEPARAKPIVRPHRLAGRRGLGFALGVAMSLTVAAGGIASGAGMVPLPWDAKEAGISFVTASDPASVPGSRVEAAFSGPDSSVWRVVSDVVDSGKRYFQDCVALSVTIGRGGSDRERSRLGGCTFGEFGPGATAQNDQQRQMGPSISLTSWSAPSGQTFAIVWGQTPLNYTKVALGTTTGAQALVGDVTNTYYFIAIPWANLPGHSTLRFYDGRGDLLSTHDIEH